MEQRFERAPVGILDVTPDGTVRSLNEMARELLGVTSEDGTGVHIGTVVPESVENRLPRAFEGPPTEQSFEEYYPDPDRWLDISLVVDGKSVTVYLEDLTPRRQSTQTIGELHDDLDRLTIINEVISEVLTELVGASTREEIAETICERLGETDISEFAWFGEREVGSDEIVVRAAAGSTGRTLDRIEECLDDSTATPEEHVVESGEPAIVQPLGEDTSVPEDIRRVAFADGLQSLLAIPLTYGASVYGVVGLYATDQNAFSERERVSFGTLGQMAGFAVNATRHRNLLLSDTVIELTLAITDTDAPLVGVTAGRDVALSVEGLVPQGEQLVCYLSVDGTPESVAELLAEHGSVGETRLVRNHEDGGTLEVTLEVRTPLAIVASYGSSVRSATFADGRGELVVEFPTGEDVRRIAEEVTRTFSGKMLAKREREREVTTPEDFREELGDRLTERQETALRTAFFADYFESPRGSSAEEVAEALDITGPTLLHHLRAGQRKLLAEFFDTPPEAER